MKFSKYVAFFSIAFIFTSCDAQKRKSGIKSSTKKTSMVSTRTKDLVYFSEGETRFLKDAQMNVTYNKLINDSRCPAGTNCIWAGAATVSITFMGTATRPMQYELSTVNMPARNLQNSVDFNGYKITLVDVTPKASATSKIGLRIEKSDGTVISGTPSLER